MLFAFLVIVSATVLSLGAFATTVHADEWSSYDSIGGGWDSYDSYGGTWDSYDTYGGSWDSYDTDGGTWDSYDTYGGGWDSYDTYNSGTYEEYNPGYYEEYNPGYYEEYNPGSYEEYNPGYYEEYNPGYYEEYTAQSEYVEQYMEQYAAGNPSYTSGSSMGGFTTGGGYSMPKMGSTGGCSTCHYTTPPRPVPPTPGCTHNCYPQPKPTPAPTPTYTENNWCTHNSCNTNVTNTNTIIDNSIVDNSIVDNSINGSFNTFTTLAPVTPQPIIQYQYQQQIPAPFCVITLTNAGAYSAQATLVWSSSNAQSAYISQVGAVAPNGTRSVTGYANQIYSLTVTGQGGTYTCQTQQYTPTYVPPAPITPSVSLTQIPYTGLSMSPFAQAMYWLSLLSVAAAGGYLLVYFKGGALALAATSMTRRQNHFVVSEQEANELTTPVVEEAEEVTTPVVSTFSLPTMASHTRDAMQMIRNASGVPQIIISRA